MTILFTPRVKAFVILLASFWAIFFYLILIISLPNNAVSPYFSKSRFKIYSIIPEGWGFFTRNPRETRRYYLVKQSNEQWLADPRLRNGTLRNFYGVDRTGRLLILEYARLEKNIPPNRWLELKDYDFSSLDLNSAKIPLSNVNLPYSLASKIPSDIIIIQRAITPWAYRDYQNKVGLPVKLARVHIIYK